MVMAFRLFIDEVGNNDLDGAASDPNIRFLSLSGVLMRRYLHDSILTQRLDALKQMLPAHTSVKPVILHRREIVRREGPFAALRDVALSSKFNAALLECLSESPYLVVTVQIDKKAHLDSYGMWHFDPYHYCLRCLIERYVLYLSRHGEHGDVVIEPRFKSADKKLKASFERIYRSGTENLPSRLVQRHLVSKDIQFCAKSANVAGLQLADLIAHPSARAMRFDRDGLVVPEDFGTQVVRILNDRRYARNPRTEVISGWGTKWLP